MTKITTIEDLIRQSADKMCEAMGCDINQLIKDNSHKRQRISRLNLQKRSAVMWMLYRAGYSQPEIGRLFNVGSAVLSRTIRASNGNWLAHGNDNRDKVQELVDETAKVLNDAVGEDMVLAKSHNPPMWLRTSLKLVPRIEKENIKLHADFNRLSKDLRKEMRSIQEEWDRFEKDWNFLKLTL